MKFLNKDKLEVLKEVWGYDSFRENQEEAVTQILNGNKDVLFIAKTGLGKSLVFQVPSVMMSGVTIVLSPLLSLMSDQVSNAGIKGLDAATYNSTMGKKQKKIVLDQLENNELDLLYIAPESILNAEMLEFIKDKVNVNFVAVDEAHCFKGSTSVVTDQGEVSFTSLYESQIKGEELPLAYSSTFDGSISYNKITKVYKNPSKPLIKMTMEDLSTLESTESHVYFTDRGEVLAKDLNTSDKLYTSKDYQTLSPVTILAISEPKEPSEEFLYDIEVETNHNYFVYPEPSEGSLEDPQPILVHNCTSSYGSDFRPKYGQIAILREFIAAPFVALTATADTKTIEDMKKTLKLGDRGHKLEEFYQDLDRHSIFYNVFPKIGNGYKQILNFMGQHKKEDTGIIYCLTKASVDDLSRFLYRQGIKAKPYHAGLSTKDKEANLAQWMNKEIQVIVATIAFGMGIDFPSVRYVIHANIPTSLEGFSQESGRASRDGLPSKSYLLYDPADSRLIKWMLKQSIKNPATLSLRLNKFAKMSQYATSKTCYRKQILNYFNQEQKEDNCNSCSNCVSVKKL